MTNKLLRYLIPLAASTALLVGAYSYTPLHHTKVVASMWLTSNHVGNFSVGDHIKFNGKFETHPGITNCDTTTTYTTTWDVASLGRCRLMPGIYLFSVGANAFMTAATGLVTYQVFNTTGNFLETGSKASEIAILLAHNNFAGNDTMLSRSSGLAIVTTQSWVEVRQADACPDLGMLDRASLVIQRIGDYP